MATGCTVGMRGLHASLPKVAMGSLSKSHFSIHQSFRYKIKLPEFYLQLRNHTEAIMAAFVESVCVCFCAVLSEYTVDLGLHQRLILCHR